MGDEQWYTNRDLFEQINEVQSDFKDLRSEMRETRLMIRQYNGLREEVAEVSKRVDEIETKADARKSFGKAIREWGGWLIAVITLILLFL